MCEGEGGREGGGESEKEGEKEEFNQLTPLVYPGGLSSSACIIAGGGSCGFLALAFFSLFLAFTSALVGGGGSLGSYRSTITLFRSLLCYIALWLSVMYTTHNGKVCSKLHCMAT